MNRRHAGRRRISRRALRNSLIVVVILLVLGLWGVHHALSPMKKAEQQSVTLAKKYAGLTNQTGFYWTNLNKTYYTVAGTNKKNQPIYVIVPQKGGQLRVLKQSEGLSRNTVLKRTWANKNPKKVLQAALGVFNNKPAWYVNYINQKGQLCYDTLNFKTGKSLQSIDNI